MIINSSVDQEIFTSSIVKIAEYTSQQKQATAKQGLRQDEALSRVHPHDGHGVCYDDVLLHESTNIQLFLPIEYHIRALS